MTSAGKPLSVGPGNGRGVEESEVISGFLLQALRVSFEDMSTLDRKIALRMALYVFLVLFLSNLGAMVDLVFHPEIRYFDEEHLIVGGITAITVILLFGALEMYLARRRNIRMTLRENEERYRALFHQSSDGIFLLSFDGILLDVNESYARMHGNRAEEMLGMNLPDFDTSQDKQMAQERMRRLLAGETLIFEVEHYHRDGHVFPLEVSARRVSFGGESCIQGLHRDITERKRAEKELKESEERLVEAQKVAHLGYYALDVATGVWTSSKILDDVFGIGDDYRRDVEGWSLLVHPEERQSMLVYFRNDVLGKKEPFNREYRIVRESDKCVRWVHGLGKVEYDPRSEPVKMIGTIQDITERKQVEEEKRNLEQQVQQAQKLESLGVLAGGIAHDFNNLLMVVLGHAELALKEISPMSGARGSITEITTAAIRAADLCRQMLAYAGKSSFALERVGLRELVEEMAHLLKTAISKKAILNLNLERGLPPIEADPSQIRQIVMNLIINASEAIGDRSGVITVSVGATRCDEEYLRRTELREDLAPGLYVHLEVTDTGGGMDAETRSRIFEPFFTTKFTGRGLGLAAVLGIVRAHKGALKVYSEPGKGTTFKILFPAMEETGKGALTNESSPLADWHGKGTILLVDDEESLLALGARMLEHLGFTVLTAADGLQALELYRQRGKEIDLVLTDLTMPHMDGAKAFGELRRLNPEVRVVLASGYSHEDVASRFAGKGLSGVLQKPYTLAKLRESLSGLMPKRLDGEG
jgi:two-component system cell cycle sensor histidine kinase/response regulator CckA